MAFTRPDLGNALPLIASGKVRELYQIDDQTLLFVATDRISAYDVIMKNVSCLSPSLTRMLIQIRVSQAKARS